MQPSKLRTFLEKHESDKGSGQETHQLRAICKMYNLSNEDDLGHFYDLYADYVKNVGMLTITEKMTPVGSLRVDLDFVYEGKVEDHRHTQEQVVSFVKDYMNEVKKYHTMVDGSVFEVCVMEKPEPTYYPSKNESKSGIHIVVPQIKTNKGVENAIKNALLPRMETHFPGLGLKKGWRDVYDSAVLNHSTWWPLLKSGKPLEHGVQPLPYRFRYTVDWESATGDTSIDDEEPRITAELIRKYSIRAHSSDASPLTEAGKIYDRVEEPARVSGGGAVLPHRGRPAVRQGDVSSRGSSPTRVTVQLPLTEDQLRRLRDHVFNLAPFRYTTYADWISTGQCLKNIHSDLEGTWLEFSAQNADSYKERETIAKWTSFTFRNDGARLSEKSLLHWSRLDNQEKYEEIEKRNIDYLVNEAVSTQTEHDVALVVFAMFRDAYKCARYSSASWFRFMTHTWKETDKGIDLQCKLSNDVARRFWDQAKIFTLQMEDIPNCPDGKHEESTCDRCRAEKKLKTYTDMRMKLKTSRFKENVMRECRELFLDEEFVNKVDENHNLIAFNNGVLDTLKMEFRDGKPEDYVSFSTNLDYDPEKPYYNHECWAELDRFIHDVLPDPEVRTYFLACLSTTLSGANESQKFHILTGNGSNGKSMLMNLMMKALGDYATKASVTMLTQGRGKTGSANPDLMRLKGKRFATMSEPDEGASFNSGYLKELTSSEPVICRDLYAGSKQMVEFVPQFRFFFSCNDKPVINTTDGGTWRRLVVVDYPNKFVVNPTQRHEKLMDESIQAKVVSTEWASCFLSYLVHLFKEGGGHRKLTPPGKVMAYTSDYKEDNDVIAKFIREKIHVTPQPPPAGEEAVAVTWSGLVVAYNEWKRANDMMGKQGASSNELRKRLDGTYGKYPIGGWTSFRLGDA
jgi:P4 family phage/plasmid primase-like protien